MIKKIQIELVILITILVGIFISSKLEISIFNKFNDFDFSLGNFYLKSFFTKITELGNSLWFFLLSIFTYLFFFFLPKKIKDKKNFYKIRISSLFLFASVLITGIFTQIIKHIIGRPRPSYVNQGDFYGFDFFKLESSYHSFPSGHTSTIFIVALVFSAITPKIKYFYLFCAFVIGFSRVVVGAHYFTDVVGGIVISFIGFKATIWMFDRVYKKNILEIIKLNSNLFFLILIVFLVLIIFITVGSSLDIFISSLFYKGKQVFVLQSFSTITFLARDIFLPFLVLYILILPLFGLYFSINKIYFNYSFKFKQIILLWVTFIFNMIFIVNLLLKNNWGRVRPNDTSQLGGDEVFGPWFQISNACNTNCSFVSGDASVGFSIIALYFLTKDKIFIWAALISGGFLGSIRILEGGHFFSDVIIAGFLIFIVNYFQFNLYKRLFINAH